MITAKQARENIRNNYKRNIRSAYKKIKYKTELEIENAASTQCCIETDKNTRLATFILMKKLERNGFSCVLQKADFNIPNDSLIIHWGK